MARRAVRQEWLRPREAAEYLGVAVSALYSWRKRGLVTFYRIGSRAVALRRDELDALARQTAPNSAAAADRSTAATLEGLNQSMRMKYGTLGDSTPVIRAAREDRDALVGLKDASA